MPLRTYLIARHGTDPERRRGHVLAFARPGRDPLHIALRRSGSSYLADHPRSGRAIPLLDQCGADRLPEATAGLTAMMADPALLARVTEAADRLDVLNPDFT